MRKGFLLMVALTCPILMSCGGGGGFSYVYFGALAEGNWEIYRIQFGGGGMHNLSSHSGYDSDPTVNFVVNKIAFVSDRSGAREIWMMDLDGSNQQRITFLNGEAAEPAFSPNGQKIAFVFSTVADGSSFYRDIVVINSDGTGFVSLTEDANENYSPAWSPNGQKIVWSNDEHGFSELYLMNPDGTGRERLTFSSWQNERPSWTPGGRILFSSGESGSLHVTIMDPVPGAVRTQLTTGAHSNNSPAASPNGQRMAFISTRDILPNLFSSRSDGTDVTKLTNFVTGGISGPASSVGR